MTQIASRKNIYAVLWSGFEKSFALFFQFVCSLIIARFLTPADFGLVGMLTIFTLLGQTITECGFSTALIRKQDVSTIDYSSVFYLNLIISSFIYVLLYFCSPFIAKFYEEPELNNISRIIFLVIPINALNIVHFTILNKEINFKILSKISILSSLLSGVLGIIVAYIRMDVWALVVQNISMFVFRTCFYWFWSKWKPILSFSLNSIRSIWKFSINVFLSRFIGTLFDNLYGLVIGKSFNSTELGYYTQADRLQRVPSNTIASTIQSVTYPLLSQLQNEDSKLKDKYKKILGITFFITTPIMLYLYLISEDLFYLLFTEEWSTAGIYLKYLCIVGILYPLSSINLNILNVKGAGHLILRLEIIRKIIMVSILFITVKYNMTILLIGCVVYSVIQYFINSYYSGKVINFSLFEQLKDLSKTFAASLISFFFCICIKCFSPKNSLLIIIVFLLLYSFVYILISYILKNKYLYILFSLMKELFSKK